MDIETARPPAMHAATGLRAPTPVGLLKRLAVIGALLAVTVISPLGLPAVSFATILLRERTRIEHVALAEHTSPGFRLSPR